MRDEEKMHVVNKIREIMDAAEPSDDGRTQASSVSICGNGNRSNRLAGRDSYDINIRVDKMFLHGTAIQKGEGVLDAQQKAKIHALVNDLVDASVVTTTPLSHKEVWMNLDRYMKVNSYHEIHQVDFEKACEYLKTQTAIFHGTTTASKKNPDWRRKRIAAIHARCKKMHFVDWRLKHMQEKYGELSMIALCDTELEELYLSVMGKK